jgi:hypothetical protein
MCGDSSTFAADNWAAWLRLWWRCATRWSAAEAGPFDGVRSFFIAVLLRCSLDGWSPACGPAAASAIPAGTALAAGGEAGSAARSGSAGRPAGAGATLDLPSTSILAMPGLPFDTQDARAGSEWLEREGRARQGELIVPLLSRFNHDLRTPLNTVVGWTHLLQQGLVDSARSKHVADVLARNTREQTVLLDEFVDDARAVLGVLKLERATLRVEDLAASALERAASLAALHGVSFDAAIDAADAKVEGDERRLKRLVYRLLAGVARRAREASAVRIAARAHDGSVHVTIDAPAGEGDWNDAALLDLRISAFVAAMHDGALAIDGTPGRAAIALRLPQRA